MPSIMIHRRVRTHGVTGYGSYQVMTVLLFLRRIYSNAANRVFNMRPRQSPKTIERLSNDDSDAQDDAKSKLNLYFTSEICKCLYLFSTQMALRLAEAKYAKTAFNSKWKYKKISRCRSCYSDDAEL